MLLHELAFLGGAESGRLGDLLTPKDSLDLLTAHLHRARSITKRIARTLRIARRPSDPQPPVPCVPSVPRPDRVLREGNRGEVFPQLLNGSVAIHHEGSLIDLIHAAHELAERESTPQVLLDFFARSSALPWPVAAKLLHTEHLVPAEFSALDIAAIRDARTFWNHYADGCDIYCGCVEAGEFPAVPGDWAFFEAAQLAALLPGLKLPLTFSRLSYLANLVRTKSSISLDLYSSPSRLPLVRHPF